MSVRRKLNGECVLYSNISYEEVKNECILKDGTPPMTLEELYQAFPFELFLLDFKTSWYHHGDELMLMHLKALIGALENRSAQKDRSVVMLYFLDDATVTLLTKHRVRFGWQGYPATVNETLAVLNSNLSLYVLRGLELMCVEGSAVNEEVVDLSNQLGLYQFPWVWDLTKTEFARLRSLNVSGIVTQTPRETVLQME